LQTSCYKSGGFYRICRRIERLHPAALAHIDEHPQVLEGRKLVLIIDQFEQWLHAHRGRPEGSLADALRHCDGGRLQCVLMIRDEFVGKIDRFMGLLGVEIQRGVNWEWVDLFDPDHARRVLTEFGRAYDRLPADLNELTGQEQAFLDNVISDLKTDEEKVVPVQLSLFAEMVKGKPWTPTTLKEVGGAAGVGMSFLEENFGEQTTNPATRPHRKAAINVLKPLLPEAGAELRTHKCTETDLLAASGYAKRPDRFPKLMHILDTELRVISPTEPPISSEDTDEDLKDSQDPYYHLTHDYLVPSLHRWLTQKQRETWRGRAELRLSERSALWRSNPENRRLPTWWEYLNILVLTRRREWTQTQRRMMRRSTQVHGVRAALLLVLAAVLSALAYEANGRIRAATLIENLSAAPTSDALDRIDPLAAYARWTQPRLAELAEIDATTEPEQRARLHARLALVTSTPQYVGPLVEVLLDASPPTVEVVCKRLGECQQKTEIEKSLWSAVWRDKPRRGLNAACALAQYASNDRQSWEPVCANVAAKLVTELARNPRDYDVLVRLLAPVRRKMSEPLGHLARDTLRTELERETALNVLVEYAKDQTDVLCDVLLDADTARFSRLLPLVKDRGAEAITCLQTELQKPLRPEETEEARERLGQRQANAALALLRLEQPDPVWRLLEHHSDPRGRSWFVARLPSYGIEPQILLSRVDPRVTDERAVEVQRTLLVTLGQFDEKALKLEHRDKLTLDVVNLFRDHPDPGLHGAAAWLLSKWQKTSQREEASEELLESERQLGNRAPDDRRRWYVNGQRQTLVMLSADSFRMGSPDQEADRYPNEVLHTRQIGRTFAIGTTEVTRGQFATFLKDTRGAVSADRYRKTVEDYAPTDDCPAVAISWYSASEYCNWLNKQEGVPEEQWCYEPNTRGEFGSGMRIKANHLQLTGYRLPTEAEWEYACRANTITAYAYGAAVSLLDSYAWYEENGDRKAHPIATRFPNAFGLFDTHGNVWEWCQNAYGEYSGNDDSPERGMFVDDDVPGGAVTDDTKRVLRGGAFYFPAPYVRSAYRLDRQPDDRLDGSGFRLARTLPYPTLASSLEE